MNTILKLLISIWKFVWKKMGTVGILLLILLFAVPVSFYMYDDNIDNYAFESQYEMGQASIAQIEKTEAVEAHFSKYDLDQRYSKKYVYQVTVDVTNMGVNPIYIDREFYGIYVENEDGNMENFQVYNYYYEMDKYDRFDTELIASSKTGSVRFLFVFDENDMPDSLTFYDEYEGDKIFELKVPAPN